MGQPRKNIWVRPNSPNALLVVTAVVTICAVATVFDGLILGLFLSWPLTLWLAWDLASDRAAHQAPNSTEQNLSGLAQTNASSAPKDDTDRVQAIIQHAEVGITIANPEGEYLTVNPKFCKFLGRDESEIIGRSYLEFAHPDEIADMEAGRGQILNLERSTPTLERRYIRKDGEVVWGSMTPAPVHGQDGEVAYFVTVVVDVTDLRHAHRSLRQSEARLQQIIDATGAGVWETDIEAGVLDADDRVKELAGYGDSFPGTIEAWAQLVHPDDELAFSGKRITGGISPNGVEHTYRIRPANGGLRWVKVNGQLEFDGDGRPIRGLGLVWDVTDEIDASEKRRALEARLEEAQKLETLGKLTGGIAHNFNNLLTIMMGSLQLLPLSKDDPVETQNGIDRALSAGKRASGLTKQLLAFSSNQSLMPDVEDLRVILSDLEPKLQASAGPEVDLVFSLPSLAIQCHVDQEQLKAAVANVVTNAQEALPEGGKIDLGLSQVLFDHQGELPPGGLSHGRYACIKISDNGKGMSAKTLERAFEPFYTTKDFSAGSGLGLSMVYGFIQQSGGAIDLASRLGEGATVALYLPVALDSHQPDAADEGLKILLVEDDAEVRRSVGNYLLAQGFRVEEVSDAASAFEIIDKDRDFDILFADIALANGMNGIDLAHKVHGLIPQLNIVLSTGLIDSRTMGGPAIPDFATLIEKPYDFEDLTDYFRDLPSFRSPVT